MATTRSGARFRSANRPFYQSLQELRQHHNRLFTEDPAFSQSQIFIGGRNRTLIQATLRFPVQSTRIRSSLLEVFADLFQTHDSAEGGFEVIITFNAILFSHETNTYSVFFGHDYRLGTTTGAAQQFGHPDTYFIRYLDEVHQIPTDINVADLLHTYRNAFDDSGVSIHSFINIIYLIYQYVETSPRPNRRANARRRTDASRRN